MTDEVTGRTPSDIVGARIREGRRRNDWTVQQLAERCQEAGATQITASVITNIELGRRDKETGQRRREVTVDELILFAKVLSIAPVHLLVPLAEVGYQLTPDGKGVRSSRARGWIRGFDPLPSTNRRIFLTEVPEDELNMPDWERRATGAELAGRSQPPVYDIGPDGQLPAGIDALVVEGTDEVLLGGDDGR